MGTAHTFGAVEGGGTKFICGVANSERRFQARTRIPTTSPDQTLHDVIQFFRPHSAGLKSLGVAMFGPLDIDGKRASSSPGSTLKTPKPGWDFIDIQSRLQSALEIPVAIDTDVNCAALAEHVLGNAKNCDPTVYITVGTGIGVGVYIHGKLLHGCMHSEMGHLMVLPEVWPDGRLDDFEGNCPYHGRCAEGMASGSAFRRRLGSNPASVPHTHDAWRLVAGYISQLVHACVLCLAPMRIVIGGGMLSNPNLLPMIRSMSQQKLGSYVQLETLGIDLDSYITSPHFQTDAGLLGALLLAQTCR